ncbi:hypothetical protein ACFSC4_14050 [Deinococcus malanensis]|uniref:hypothetical protein n=1 Tax=Deinococcus malanensis TaxID=1706855 RepID=UPI003639CAC9
MHTFLAVPQGFNELEQAEVVRVREGLLAARAQRTAAQLADIGDLSGALLALSSIRNRLQVESLRSAISSPLSFISWAKWNVACGRTTGALLANWHASSHTPSRVAEKAKT